ncbi:MAG: tetratricopeptide repeat protein, partial [bacterium]
MTGRAERLGARLAPIVSLFLALVSQGVVHAGPTPQRVLEAIEMRETGGGIEIVVRFMTPVRYLRHAPATSGTTLQVQIDPIALARGDALLLASHEAMAAPPDSPVPLIEVAYEGGRPDGRFLVLRFSRTVHYEVRQGGDFRSMVIAVRERSSGGMGGASEEGDPSLRSNQLMATGRAALTAGDLAQAIRVFTKVMTLPESENTREAKELLGVARERNGQLAHAKAEYEEYLKWYPGSEGAQRVRQRLDAMLTASAHPPEKSGGGSRPSTRPTEFELFGSVSTQYRREVLDSGATGKLVTDSSLFSDLSLSTRARSADYLWRGLAAGSYRADFTDTTDGNDTRISAAFIDVGQRVGPYS